MFDQVLGGVPTPLKLFIALAAVIALIVVAAWLTKRFGGQRLGSVAMSGRSRQPRLGVLDVLAVDGRRRLVIVRRDNVEHLVMIGGPNDLVVESGILRVPSGGSAQPQREATAVIPQREPTIVSPEAPTPRPALQPQPAPVRAANPVPAPPPQPLRPVEQPARAPRSVDAPSIVPASPAASAPFTPPPPPSKGPAAPKPAPLPAAPTISSVAPSRPSSPAPAAPPSPIEPAPERPAPAPIVAPAPVVAPAPSPIRPAAAAAAAIAGTGAARVAGIASPSDIAERLAAALKRPVSPQSRAPEPVKPEPAKTIEPAVAPELAAVSSSTAAESGDYASPEITVSAQDSDQASAPEVKPEPRPALADAAEPAEDDGDPFSLEADLAALLGRDMGKSKD